MPRLLVLNNYPLDRVGREVELGETPDHLMYGVNRFAAFGYDVEILPYPARGPWNAVQGLIAKLRIPIELGDLQQQSHAWRDRHQADLIYAPCGTQTHSLQYLRALRLLDIPVVTLMHHPWIAGRLDFLRHSSRSMFIKGGDALPCLNHSVAVQLMAKGCKPERAPVLAWGPDLAFYGEWEPPGRGVIAAGRTGRDFGTFGVAATEAGTRATLIALKGSLGEGRAGWGSNLEVVETENAQPVPGANRGWMKYPELLRKIREHAAIAIPLFEQETLAGLTGLADAMGLGRAVLMTRNKQIDLDIEAERIGFWLDPGDVAGWADRLRWVDSHPEEVAEMGQRSRRLAIGQYNSGIFARNMDNLFKSVLLSSSTKLTRGRAQR